MKNGKLTVAIVGMGFGSCFLPIYLKHPDVEHVIMVDTNPDQLKALADMYLLDESYYTTDFESVLQNPDVDAVHLVIPPALHAPMSVQVLNAGKHCACTIPMGMSMKELEDVIKARKASGKHYMFMETSVYTREYLYVKELYESGAMGKLQYMRCACYPSPVFYDALDDKVGLLKLIPGTPAAVLEFMLDRFDGLVIESFGVGGLPEYEGDASYFDIIHRGIARGKLVVMTTQVPNEGSNLAVYHVGGRLKSALRLLEAHDMTTEAAVAKLMWIMGQTRDFDEAERLFYRPVARDILYEN